MCGCLSILAAVAIVIGFRFNIVACGIAFLVMLIGAQLSHQWR